MRTKPLMPEARRRRVQVLFEAAFERSPEEQVAFLDHACADDADLRREVENILMAARASTDPRLKNLAAVGYAGHEAATLVDSSLGHALDSTGERVLLPAPGATIDQYELIRRLGRGGMGDVYLARDTKLARRVAIKFLQHPDRSLNERFLLEAQATARCTHENIVVIHDVKEHGRVPFMVLEYLKGQTLGEIIGDGKLPPGRAVQLMVPVVRALVCAHQQKIVHRDLKPANIFMTETGTIKVLDFGVAKVIAGVHGSVNVLASTAEVTATSMIPAELTQDGALVGTLPYMSPEQWGADTIDHCTDLWAVGIMLYRMLVGRHPLAPLDGRQLMVTAVLEQPMPSAHDADADMPPELANIIDACLKKRKAERIASAEQLLAALEPLLPGQRPVELHAGDNPYAGLNAFQEADAGRFFGRACEVGTVMAKLHGTPLIGIVGPSGVGKSSFVRAGIIPALKQSGEPWEALVIRPGRHPMVALSNIIVPMLSTDNTDLTAQVAEHQSTLQRLYQEPGYLGTILRSHARTRGGKILLFVDQFEELFTLNREAEERRAFTACLAGMADDPLSPLRLMLSIRSDFLDRMTEDHLLMSELGPGMFFLAPPNREGLREAIMRPLEMARYRFEAPAIVENMLDTLQATPGCLPLLQFAASKLWEARDRERCVLTEHSYDQLGGVAGALATHADAVLAGMSSAKQSLVRAVFERLVTPERTRALIITDELRALHQDASAVDDIVQHLATMRLLVIERGVDGADYTVELVHESLIERWPTLARWLTENQEDAAFLTRLRGAAQEWEKRDRDAVLLWRDALAREARLWRAHYRGSLPRREQAYLDAVFALAKRRRILVVIAALMGILSGVIYSTLSDQAVERREADRARAALDDIAQARDQARAALVQAQEEKIKAEQSAQEAQRARDAAEQAAREAQQARDVAEAAQAHAQTEKTRAEQARDREQRARSDIQILLDRERARRMELERMRGCGERAVR